MHHPNLLSAGNFKSLPEQLKAKTYLIWPQHYGYYEGHAGHNLFFDDRASGAYIFRPKAQRRKDFKPKGETLLYEGPVFTEIQQEFSDYVSQSLRLYNDSADVEVDWLVGPIPLKGGKRV